MGSSQELTPIRLDEEDVRLGAAALRRGIIEPKDLDNTLARIRNLRSQGRRVRLQDVLEDELPTVELGAIRKALRPARRRPVIRGYKILSTAGRGGLGTVYRARQMSMQRIVALKVLPKVLVESRREVDRFLREAKLAAGLNHANIVRIYEVGRVKNLYFISMEFVPGESLSDRVRRSGVLPLGRALAMARDTASALAHAHERGVIHRDLKPANIMLRSDGPVKIVDLGLAMGVTALPADRITEIGVLIGTPEFMAPEQARDPTHVDGRADVYALGASLYFALSGRAPLEGQSTLDTLARLFRGEIMPLEELRPELPPGVHRWVEKAMAPEPEDRFPGARSALQALDELLAALPESERSWHEKIDDTRVSDRNPQAEEPAPAGVRPWKWLALCAAGGLMAGLFLMALLFQDSPPGPARQPAEEPASPAEPVTSLAVEKDARAQALFDKAREYFAEHPEDRAGAIERLREVMTRYPGTLAAFRARDEIDALEKADGDPQSR